MEIVHMKIYPMPFDVNLNIPKDIVKKGNQAIEDYIRTHEECLNSIAYQGKNYCFEIELSD